MMDENAEDKSIKTFSMLATDAYMWRECPPVPRIQAQDSYFVLQNLYWTLLGKVPLGKRKLGRVESCPPLTVRLARVVIGQIQR